jgi:hypothetical protein
LPIGVCSIPGGSEPAAGARGVWSCSGGKLTVQLLWRETSNRLGGHAPSALAATAVSLRCFDRFRSIDLPPLARHAVCRDPAR